MSFLKKVQNNVAHTSKLPSLGNQDLRSLQDIITTEKNFLSSNTKSATDFKKNSEALKQWSTEEGPDLNDVVGKISLLLEHYSASQNRLNTHLSTVRLHFKSIRTREEALSELKGRKRSLGGDIEKVEKKLAKMGPENKELMKVTAQLKEMRSEMEGLHIEVMTEEAALGDFKRRTTREALGNKSAALLELAEKLTIVAEMSKLMLEEIPIQATQPGMPRAEYYGFAKTEQLLHEATRAIADVGFNPSGPSAGIPRFGDMTLADSTAQSQGFQQSYAGEEDAYPEMLPTHASGAEMGADTGYSPATDRALTGDEVTRTPIYAAHASRSSWAQEGAAPSDPATNEWAQSSYDRHADPSAPSAPSAAAAAAMAATAGHDLNQVPGHGDPNTQDGGFIMQTGGSHSGSAGGGMVPGQIYGSNRNSADYQSAGQHSNVIDNAPAGVTVRAASTQGGHESDAYDGYTASSNHAEPTQSNPVGMLGAPTLPPLRTATPLNSAVPGAPPTNVGSPATYNPNATDDSAYFQSIGSTRAMQEAVRRPTSGQSNRVSSYNALGSQPPASGVGEGKKVTAAAFRRGFSRNPSAQANMTSPYDEPSQSYSNNPLPLPPGAYTGTTPDSEVAPLHISKRNSGSHNPLAAAASAGTPAGMSGRRYSGDHELGVSGSDNPAPPYLGGEEGVHQQHGAFHPTQHQQQGGYGQMPGGGVQRQQSAQYAEYAAPPPPGYGYA